MLNPLLAGFGGFIGSMLRYLLNTWIYNLFEYPTFPYGVLVINILGCLLIGFLSCLAETRDFFTPQIRIFMFIGILGGFTTFSSFGYDTFGLMRGGQMLYAAINVCVQVFVGLAAVWGGYTLAKLL